MTTPLRRAGRSPVLAFVLVIAVLLVGVTAYQSRITGEIRKAQLKACERGKLDRTANARAFRAQSDYLNLVLDAASVKADVKRAARANQSVQDWAASSLEARTGSNLDCERAVNQAVANP